MPSTLESIYYDADRDFQAGLMRATAGNTGG
jgi:hypothetical protein